MARLPQSGADDGEWGDILNTYLSVSLQGNGSLKPDIVGSSAIQANAVTNAKLASGSGSDGDVLTKNSAAAGGFDWSPASGAPLATAATPGLVQLAGDLSGTAASPTVPALAGKQPLDSDLTAIAALTPANDDLIQRKAGAWTNRTPAQLKTDLVLVKGDVGLGNVDNTSDAGKPVSTAQQTALNLKANDSAVVHNTGAETIAGIKTFSSAPVVPSSSFPESAVTNLVTDLAGRTTTANGGGETYFDAGNSGAAITLNLTNGNVQKLTLTNSCTITLTSPATGAYRSMLLYLFQDGTGSRTVTWPASVKWGTAGVPTLSTAATKMDKILLDTVDGGTTWYGVAGPGGF